MIFIFFHFFPSVSSPHLFPVLFFFKDEENSFLQNKQTNKTTCPAAPSSCRNISLHTHTNNTNRKIMFSYKPHELLIYGHLIYVSLSFCLNWMVVLLVNVPVSNPNPNIQYPLKKISVCIIYNKTIIFTTAPSFFHIILQFEISCWLDS